MGPGSVVRVRVGARVTDRLRVRVRVEESF